MWLFNGTYIKILEVNLLFQSRGLVLFAQHLKQTGIIHSETHTKLCTNHEQKRTKATTQHVSTINDSQITFFKQESAVWWDTKAEFKLLHSMNQVRVPFIQNNLYKSEQLDKKFANSKTPLNKLNIVDIGCGGGILAEALSKLGANVTGIDPCKELIDIANIHAVNNPDIKNKINYIHGTAEDYVDEFKNKFDVVVNSECLEHVDNPTVLVESCTNILKPGGSIFITTINKTYWGWLVAILTYEQIIGVIPKGAHTWDKLIPLDWLKNTLARNDCKTKEVIGFKYNLYSNTWNMRTDPTVYYALHAIKK